MPYEAKSRFASLLLIVLYSAALLVCLSTLFGLTVFVHSGGESSWALHLFETSTGLGRVVFALFLLAFGLWAVQIHRDLKGLFPDYSIGPLKAVGLLLVPFVNSVGVWIVFSRMVAYLKGCGGRIAKLGDQAQFFLILFYIVGIFGRLGAGLLTRWILGPLAEDLVVDLFKLYAQIGFGFFCFGILVGCVHRAIMIKAEQGSDADMREMFEYAGHFA